MDAMQRTSSSKLEVASWYGNETQADCSAGLTITLQPSTTQEFRLSRLSLDFDANVAVTLEIWEDNPDGAEWDQLIRRVTVPAPGAGLTTAYTFIGGQGYEYDIGTAIRIVITAVAANVNCSWAFEQI